MAESGTLPPGFGELEVLAVGTVLLVEALSGLSLNILTILSFCKTPELRTPSHLLVLSLALADTGISLNALVAATSSLLRRWPYGSEGCQAHGFQGFATALASICSSAAIAWGRYHHFCTQTSPASSSPWPFSTSSCPFSSQSYPIGSWSRNSGRPAVPRTLLLGWGPYALLYLYATIADATSLSPKLQMVPALIAKTMPTVNAVNYALGSEMVHRGIWQCLSPQRRERSREQ
ncbi:RGR [Cervus elaphus hippelaphus]|uniref:RGR n=1 Tax=Cervus elaphus hippelaphus TaxID=46360 RepID=A0A212CPB5_CEREH|nr:RGR [Cervus elaphus hippelaphus]